MFRTVPLFSIRSMDQNGTSSILILLTSCQKNLFDIYHCCVYSEKIHDDGQSNCPKHVEFYSKNKFDEHLVGFIGREYFIYMRENDQRDALFVPLIYSNWTILYMIRTNDCSSSGGYFSRRNVQYFIMQKLQ